MTEPFVQFCPRVIVSLIPRQLRSVMGVNAWLLWAATVLPAAALASISFKYALVDGSHWQRFAVLTAGASVAQLASVRLNRNRVFHPAIMFVLAGVLLLPLPLLVLMCVVQHLGDWLRQRYAWYIQPFNIANYVFAACAAALSFNLLESMGVGTAVAGSAAAVAFVVVNRTLLLSMLGAARHMRPAETGLLRHDDIALELVLALMGIPLALLAMQGAAAAAVTIAPLLLIYLAQGSARQLEDAAETIQERNVQLAETTELVIARSTAALEALSATIDARDAYTAGHSRRVRAISQALAEEIGLDTHAVETVAQAALLHDIGKIAVPDSVLLKKGKLDSGEWLVMRSHPQEGARIIERLGYLADVVPAIRHHHERVDGGGYPDGLQGEQIPLPARIIHVADSLDAMLTRRVYRDAMSLEEATAEIERGAGSDFCRDCVAAFQTALAEGRLNGLLPGAAEQRAPVLRLTA
jgi:putative nucleotidyltransferase with HDIG domain